jgi:hypothetical protein
MIHGPSNVNPFIYFCNRLCVCKLKCSFRIKINSTRLFSTYCPVPWYLRRPQFPPREQISYKTDELFSKLAPEHAAVLLKIMCVISLLIHNINYFRFPRSSLPLTNFCLTFRKHKLNTSFYVFYRSYFIIDLLPYVSVESTICFVSIFYITDSLHVLALIYYLQAYTVPFRNSYRHLSFSTFSNMKII